MAPNYAAGKDMATGVAATFKGEVKGKGKETSKSQEGKRKLRKSPPDSQSIKKKVKAKKAFNT